MCPTAPGELALAIAASLWKSHIIDPRIGDTKHEYARSQIDHFIRGPQGLHWTWEDPYRGDSDFAWCGAFAAYCWGGAGLIERWRLPFWASTYRLDRWASYRPIGRTHNPPPNPGQSTRLYCRFDGQSSARDLDTMGIVPLPGDILLIGDSHSGYGRHIAMVDSYDSGNGIFTTIEGNAIGILANGIRGQGVIKSKRYLGETNPLDSRHVRRLIRPAASDLA